MAIASLSGEEVSLLMKMNYAPNTVWGQKVKGVANWYSQATSRLLDKQLIRVAGQFGEDQAAFAFTPLGHVVQQVVKKGLRTFEGDKDLLRGAAETDDGEDAQPGDQPEHQ